MLQEQPQEEVSMKLWKWPGCCVLVYFYNNQTNKILCAFDANKMLLFKNKPWPKPFFFFFFVRGYWEGTACKGSEYSLAIQSRGTMVPKGCLVTSSCLCCTSSWQPLHLVLDGERVPKLLLGSVGWLRLVLPWSGQDSSTHPMLQCWLLNLNLQGRKKGLGLLLDKAF